MKKTLGFLLCLLAPLPLRAQAPADVLKQGAVLYQQGQYDQAVSVYQAGLQSAPQDWRLYQGLGSCFYRLDQLPEALQAFDASLTIHPDNPSVRSFAESLRSKVGPAPTPTPAPLAPPPLPAAGTGASAAPGLPPSAPALAMPGLPENEQQARADFEQGKALEKKGQDALRALDLENQLSPDDEYVARWGAPKSSFHDDHFTLDFGVLTPTGANLDLGFFLSPTTNLGLAFAYFPLAEDYGYNVGSSGNLVYLQPRIKFYSSPGGLSTFQGFCFTYYGLHQGVNFDGYLNTSFDIFGLGYMFGFRTLPMDGMTMEIGWNMGLAVISVTDSTDTYNSSTGTFDYLPSTTVVPFPYIIPEFRFGFTF